MLCPRCKKRELTGTEIRCRKCEEQLEQRRETKRKKKELGLCARCGKERGDSRSTLYCDPCRNIENVRTAKNQRSARKRKRIRVLEHYGGCCVCCGESEPDFLDIDHVHNNGNQHREQIRDELNWYTITDWLIKHNFPEGFQVLCRNCNYSKHKNGGTCIHQLKRG